MSFGITTAGFSIKRLPDIVEEMNENLKEVFGQVDTSPESVLGQAIGVFAKMHADIWEQMAAVYAAGHPSEAAGVQLDYIGEYNSLTRRPALESESYIGCRGDVGTLITLGTQVRSALSGDLFESMIEEEITNLSKRKIYIRIEEVIDSTNYTLVINLTGYVYNSGLGSTKEIIAQGLIALIVADIAAVVIARDMGAGDIILETKDNMPFDATVDSNMSYFTPVLFKSLNTGPIPVNEDSLNIIETPLSGLEEVNNFEEGTIGRNEETDAQFRVRRLLSLQVAGAGTLPSIVSRILDDIAGVTQVKGFENRESYEVDGRPSHSFEVVVEGGATADIGNLLWLIKPAGIRTFGNVFYDVLDSNGDLQRMFFSRPVPKYAWVEVTISYYDEEIFPDDGVAQIQNQILTYGNTFEIGLNIIPQRFFGPIFQVPGIEEISVKVAITGDPGDIPVYQSTPIEINDNWLAVFSLSRITVLIP